MTTVDDFNEPVLSPEQQAAVDSGARALVVVASAGSGKTEVVARRIQRLLVEDSGGSGRVLALTYTVKAADELRARLDTRLGALARRVDSETIHGFAHSLLRTHGTRIGLPLEPELLARDEDRVELFRSWLRDRGETEPEDLKSRLVGFDLARAKGEDSEGLNDWLQALEDHGALDYPALLARATQLLTVASARRQIRRLYTAIVVDEAQNLTKAQYDLLVAAQRSDEGEVAIPTMLVGDDKQSIVSFAGADPGLIGSYAKAFAAERHELHTNFRSATVLATASSKVAAAARPSSRRGGSIRCSRHDRLRGARDRSRGRREGWRPGSKASWRVGYPMVRSAPARTTRFVLKTSRCYPDRRPAFVP